VVTQNLLLLRRSEKTEFIINAHEFDRVFTACRAISFPYKVD